MYTERTQWLPVTVTRFPGDTPSHGFASGLIDYGQEHHVLHEVIIDGTGEIWYVTNGNVRVRPNPSMKSMRGMKGSVVPVDRPESPQKGLIIVDEDDPVYAELARLRAEMGRP